METIVVPAGYCEHPPPPDLADHVACFWTSLAPLRSGAEPPRVQRVLPDGCVDIIAAFGRDNASESTELRTVFAVGAMTKPVVFDQPGPRLRVGARFTPGSAYAVFGIPASELTDQQVSLRAMTRTVDRGSLERDVAPMAALSSDEPAVDAMIALVRGRLRAAAVVPASVRAAVRTLAAACGNLRIERVANDVGITRQQLAKQFAMHVGVAPKMLARVLRTQAALARADAARSAYPRHVRSRAIDWSAIANDLGYYDQPHFIDDFKALTGTTPGEWAERA